MRTVVRENDIAGEEPKHQQHPDRLSLIGTRENNIDKTLSVVTRQCAGLP